MYLPVSYEKVLATYPDAVAKVVNDQKNSSSRSKDVPADQLAWGYDWCVVVHGAMTFDQMMQSIAEGPKEEKSQTLDEKVADYVNRCRVVVKGTHSRGRWYSDPLEVVPEEIVEKAREMFQKQIDEKARVESLPPGERAKLMDDNFKALMRGTGFMAVRVQ